MQPSVPNYLQTGKVDSPEGNAHPAVCPFGMLTTKDSNVIVSVLGKKLWAAFCNVINRPDIVNSERFDSNEHRLLHRQPLRDIIRPIFKTKTTTEWLKLLEHAGIPCAKVNNIKEACEFDQILARNMLCEAGNYKLAGNPMKFSNYSDEKVKAPIPSIGEHTTEIIHEFQ